MEKRGKGKDGKQEIERLGGEQLGSRKRDDYADGTARIPVNSPAP